MAPLADFLLAYAPLPKIPHYLTSYVPGKTPLSTPQEVYPALATYLVVIFSIRWFMKDRAPLKLQYPFQAHNIFLSAGSALLLVLIAEEVVPEVFKHGVFHAMCNVQMWTPVRFYAFCPPQIASDALTWHTAVGILLYDQLFLQVYRTYRYGLPRVEEEASWYVLFIKLLAGNS